MVALIDEAVAAGARERTAAQVLGLSVRTVQRWRRPDGAEDNRHGPNAPPANRLTAVERQRILAVANSPEYGDLSPKQIVPRLADEGTYVASESTFYRVLREQGQLAHRSKAKPPTRRPKPELEAAAPNRVWTWDITYLRGPVKGAFLYLYLVVDMYSRRIVGWRVHGEESAELAKELVRGAWNDAGCPEGLKLHSDNGPAMKGATLLATLQWLGIVPSFSRPSVSDDNPFSEALFRTLKYRPSFPDRPFTGIQDAHAWVQRFVAWYNGVHRHSAIRYVAPDERHFGQEKDILERRHQLYQRARQAHPERWAHRTRNWTPAGPVRLNATLPAQEVNRAD
jgi:putative transposase